MKYETQSALLVRLAKAQNRFRPNAALGGVLSLG